MMTKIPTPSCTLRFGVLLCSLAFAASGFAQNKLLELDLTKGPPNDSRVKVEGGKWDNGWRVVGDLDRIVVDLGLDVQNGYVEVVVTRSGRLEFPDDIGRKRNWMGVFGCLAMNQCSGGYARTGAAMYDFSKAEIFASNQSLTIAEVKFGKMSDWKMDDQTEHVVRAEVKNGVMTWTNNAGGKASAGDAKHPVTHFRFATFGGILDRKDGWHSGSLVGLRVKKISVMDYDPARPHPHAKAEPAPKVGAKKKT